MATNTPVLLYRGKPLFGTTPLKANISNKALTTNLATLTTSAVHGITQVGMLVTVQGVDSTFDGTFVIHSIPTTTSFTYVKTIANVVSVAVSPVGFATFNSTVASGFTVTNKVIQNTIATLTTSAAHGLAINDLVAVTIGDSTYDTLNAVVLAVPTSTTFQYVTATTTGATTAVTQGAFGKYPSLYTVPASTTTIATNIVVANPFSSSGTFTLLLDGNELASSATIAANSTAYIDLKQTMATTKKIIGTASNPYINFQISGMAVV